MNSDDTEVDGGSDLAEETVPKVAENEFHKEYKMNCGTNEQAEDDEYQTLKDDIVHLQFSRMDLAQRSAMLYVLQQVEEGRENYDLAYCSRSAIVPVSC